MATLHHNISGELTQELLAAGDNINVFSISICNIHDAIFCYVDLYIEKKLTGQFRLLKKLKLPVGASFMYEGVRFDNGDDEFGLYIKLTNSAGETPTVDVIIS